MCMGACELNVVVPVVTFLLHSNTHCNIVGLLVAHPVPAFEGTEQCKLLDVTAGRDKVHVTRHRSTKKRGASKKEALFLHTGDPERFGDRKVDPANPMQVERKQVAHAGKTDPGRKRASTGWLRLPQEDALRYHVTTFIPTRSQDRSHDSVIVSFILRDTLNDEASPQKQSSSSSNLKGRNMVIEASWKSNKVSGIARRVTVSSKPLSSAGLVSRASQKKKESGGDIGASATETDQVQEGLQRNKQRSKSVVVKSTMEEKTGRADSRGPPTKARWPTGVESRVAGKEKDVEAASSRAGAVQAMGGSQTFQVPLRSVSSNQAPFVKGDTITETEEPAWVAIARVSPFMTTNFAVATSSNIVKAHCYMKLTQYSFTGYVHTECMYVFVYVYVGQTACGFNSVLNAC